MVVELVQLIMTHMEITSDPAVVGDIRSSAAGSGTAHSTSSGTVHSTSSGTESGTVEY